MHRRTPFLLAAGSALAAVAVLAACGGSGPAGSSRPRPAAAQTSPAAATAATPTYATKYFTVPVDIAVPPWLEPAPTEDTAHFVTFSSADGSRALRILNPLVVYPPGSSTAAPVPTDYLGYLLGQTADGGHLTDRADLTVDGHAAAVLTATTDESLDGSLGCPETDMTPADCFGLQSDLVLRIAVIETDHGPLLIWLRNNLDDKPDMKAEAKRFAQFLSGVRFSDRPAQAAPAALATPLDGTYRWTLTRRDALAHGTPGDKTAESLASYPWTFTMTLAAGRWHLHGEFGEGPSEDDSGTYQATADRLDSRWPGEPETLSYDVLRDENGTLHLTPLATSTELAAGDAYVWTTRPWKRL